MPAMFKLRLHCVNTGGTFNCKLNHGDILLPSNLVFTPNVGQMRTSGAYFTFS